MKKKTPEEIQAMRDEVAAFDQEEATQRAKEQAETAKPLIDVVNSDNFAKLEEAVPVLDELVAKMPNIRVHVDALRHGLFGLRQEAGMFPAVDAQATVATAPAADA